MEQQLVHSSDPLSHSQITATPITKLESARVVEEFSEWLSRIKQLIEIAESKVTVGLTISERNKIIEGNAPQFNLNTALNDLANIAVNGSEQVQLVLADYYSTLLDEDQTLKWLTPAALRGNEQGLNKLSTFLSKPINRQSIRYSIDIEAAPTTQLKKLRVKDWLRELARKKDPETKLILDPIAAILHAEELIKKIQSSDNFTLNAEDQNTLYLLPELEYVFVKHDKTSLLPKKQSQETQVSDNGDFAAPQSADQTSEELEHKKAREGCESVIKQLTEAIRNIKDDINNNKWPNQDPEIAHSIINLIEHNFQVNRMRLGLQNDSDIKQKLLAIKLVGLKAITDHLNSLIKDIEKQRTIFDQMEEVEKEKKIREKNSVTLQSSLENLMASNSKEQLDQRLGVAFKFCINDKGLIVLLDFLTLYTELKIKLQQLREYDQVLVKKYSVDLQRRLNSFTNLIAGIPKPAGLSLGQPKLEQLIANKSRITEALQKGIGNAIDAVDDVLNKLKEEKKSREKSNANIVLIKTNVTAINTSLKEIDKFVKNCKNKEYLKEDIRQIQKKLKHHGKYKDQTPVTDYDLAFKFEIGEETFSAWSAEQVQQILNDTNKLKDELEKAEKEFPKKIEQAIQQARTQLGASIDTLNQQLGQMVEVVSSFNLPALLNKYPNQASLIQQFNNDIVSLYNQLGIEMPAGNGIQTISFAKEKLDELDDIAKLKELKSAVEKTSGNITKLHKRIAKENKTIAEERERIEASLAEFKTVLDELKGQVKESVVKAEIVNFAAIFGIKSTDNKSFDEILATVKSQIGTYSVQQLKDSNASLKDHISGIKGVIKELKEQKQKAQTSATKQEASEHKRRNKAIEELKSAVEKLNKLLPDLALKLDGKASASSAEISKIRTNIGQEAQAPLAVIVIDFLKITKLDTSSIELWRKSVNKACDNVKKEGKKLDEIERKYKKYYKKLEEVGGLYNSYLHRFFTIVPRTTVLETKINEIKPRIQFSQFSSAVGFQEMEGVPQLAFKKTFVKNKQALVESAQALLDFLEDRNGLIATVEHIAITEEEDYEEALGWLEEAVADLNKGKLSTYRQKLNGKQPESTSAISELIFALRKQLGDVNPQGSTNDIVIDFDVVESKKYKITDIDGLIQNVADLGNKLETAIGILEWDAKITEGRKREEQKEVKREKERTELNKKIQELNSKLADIQTAIDKRSGLLLELRMAPTKDRAGSIEQEKLVPLTTQLEVLRKKLGCTAKNCEPIKPLAANLQQLETSKSLIAQLLRSETSGISECTTEINTIFFEKAKELQDLLDRDCEIFERVKQLKEKIALLNTQLVQFRLHKSRLSAKQQVSSWLKKINAIRELLSLQSISNISEIKLDNNTIAEILNKYKTPKDFDTIFETITKLEKELQTANQGFVQAIETDRVQQQAALQVTLDNINRQLAIIEQTDIDGKYPNLKEQAQDLSDQLIQLRELILGKVEDDEAKSFAALIIPADKVLSFEEIDEIKKDSSTIQQNAENIVKQVATQQQQLELKQNELDSKCQKLVQQLQTLQNSSDLAQQADNTKIIASFSDLTTTQVENLTTTDALLTYENQLNDALAKVNTRLAAVNQQNQEFELQKSQIQNSLDQLRSAIKTVENVNPTILSDETQQLRAILGTHLANLANTLDCKAATYEDLTIGESLLANKTEFLNKVKEYQASIQEVCELVTEVAQSVNQETQQHKQKLDIVKQAITQLNGQLQAYIALPSSHLQIYQTKLKAIQAKIGKLASDEDIIRSLLSDDKKLSNCTMRDLQEINTNVLELTSEVKAGIERIKQEQRQIAEAKTAVDEQVKTLEKKITEYKKLNPTGLSSLLTEIGELLADYKQKNDFTLATLTEYQQKVLTHTGTIEKEIAAEQKQNAEKLVKLEQDAIAEAKKELRTAIKGLNTKLAELGNLLGLEQKSHGVNLSSLRLAVGCNHSELQDVTLDESKLNHLDSENLNSLVKDVREETEIIETRIKAVQAENRQKLEQINQVIVKLNEQLKTYNELSNGQLQVYQAKLIIIQAKIGEPASDKAIIKALVSNDKKLGECNAHELDEIKSSVLELTGKVESGIQNIEIQKQKIVALEQQVHKDVAALEAKIATYNELKVENPSSILKEVSDLIQDYKNTKAFTLEKLQEYQQKFLGFTEIMEEEISNAEKQKAEEQAKLERIARDQAKATLEKNIEVLNTKLSELRSLLGSNQRSNLLDLFTIRSAVGCIGSELDDVVIDKSKFDNHQCPTNEILNQLIEDIVQVDEAIDKSIKEAQTQIAESKSSISSNWKQTFANIKKLAESYEQLKTGLAHQDEEVGTQLLSKNSEVSYKHYFKGHKQFNSTLLSIIYLEKFAATIKTYFNELKNNQNNLSLSDCETYLVKLETLSSCVHTAENLLLVIKEIKSLIHQLELKPVSQDVIDAYKAKCVERIAKFNREHKDVLSNYEAYENLKEALILIKNEIYFYLNPVNGSSPSTTPPDSDNDSDSDNEEDANKDSTFPGNMQPPSSLPTSGESENKNKPANSGANSSIGNQSAKKTKPGKITNTPAEGVQGVNPPTYSSPRKVEASVNQEVNERSVKTFNTIKREVKNINNYITLFMSNGALSDKEESILRDLATKIDQLDGRKEPDDLIAGYNDAVTVAKNTLANSPQPSVGVLIKRGLLWIKVQIGMHEEFKVEYSRPSTLLKGLANVFALRPTYNATHTNPSVLVVAAQKPATRNYSASPYTNPLVNGTAEVTNSITQAPTKPSTKPSDKPRNTQTEAQKRAELEQATRAYLASTGRENWMKKGINQVYVETSLGSGSPFNTTLSSSD